VRHNPVIITLISCGILLGTWIERYTWISGSVHSKYFHVPMSSVQDIAMTLVVFAVAWFAVRWSLNRYGLTKAS
ncbi:MAG: hypothetical protein ABIT92_05580, partial [Gammaproteobacteria bacterium]